MSRSGSIGSAGASPPDRLSLSSATPGPGAGRVSPSRLAATKSVSTGDTETDRLLPFIRRRRVSIDMDGVEDWLAVESNPESEESFGSAFGFEDRRAVVEFLAVLVVVIALAAATSVVLVPA